MVFKLPKHSVQVLALVRELKFSIHLTLLFHCLEHWNKCLKYFYYKSIKAWFDKLKRPHLPFMERFMKSQSRYCLKYWIFMHFIVRISRKNYGCRADLPDSGVILTCQKGKAWWTKCNDDIYLTKWFPVNWWFCA